MHLPDVNVWLAMTFEVHAHHEAAAAWFDTARPASVGWCRLTQHGFLRLATNPAVFPDDAVTLEAAWSLFDRLSDDERVTFVEEPPGLEAAWRAHSARRTYSPKVWNDALLAAFAQQTTRELVTFDRGLANYAGVSVRVLGSR